jgi:hypothetical protein
MPSSNRKNQMTPSSRFENQNMANSNHQRPHEVNQQIAKSVRPQLPRDGSADMARWQPGTLPKGGFRSVFDFSDTPTYNTKKSPTSGGGGKVY